MKINKKLLTRLFALLASLVLVVALAIPCFADDTVPADETPAPTQKVLTEYYFADYAEFYSFIAQGDVPQILFPMQGSTLTLNLHFSMFMDNVNDDIVSVVYTNDTLVLGHITITYVNFTQNGATMTGYVDSSGPTEDTYTIEELDALVTSAPFWVYQELQIPDTPDTPDTPTEPTTPAEPEPGWYGQVNTIIKNAVFGENTLLNEAQQFTLDQISLLLTLVVILLPLIICGVFLARCFR